MSPRNVKKKLGKVGKEERQAAQKIVRKAKFTKTVPRPALSYLEQVSVKESTLVRYEKLATEFVARATRLKLDWVSDVELDAVLCQKMNWMFFEGQSAEEGSRLLAALKFFLPEVSRLGPGSLPRTTRALGSWRKMAPANQGMPMPFVVLCAIVGFTLRRFRSSVVGRNLALKWLVAFHTYMRPGEVDKLKCWQIVRPTHRARAPPYTYYGVLLHPTEEKRPGKTGMWDEAILIDNENLFPALGSLLQTQKPHESCWLLSSADEIKAINEAIARLGLEDLGLCRYSMRHGGASHDLLTKSRSVEAVKRRGRWRSDSSLKRYGKETRILSELNKVAPQVIELGEAVAKDIVSLLMNDRLPAAIAKRVDGIVK